MTLPALSPGAARSGKTIDKWYPGHYEKIARTDMFTGTGEGTINSTKLDTIFTELSATPALRGIKFVTHWGWIENNTTGVETSWNWNAIDEIVQRLHTLRQSGVRKYFMLAIDMETDGIAAADLNDLLPPDLVAAGTYTPAKAGYSSQLYAWPWGSGSVAPTGWYAKLWEPIVMARFTRFIQALGRHVVPNTDGKTLDEGDYLITLTTLESATSGAYDTYQGGSLALYETGMFDIAKALKNTFRYTPVTMGLNYTRAYIADIIPQLGALKIGINTPNGNYSSGLITPTGNVGILLYYQNATYYNSLILTSEAQGDDYKATTGIDARDDKVNLYDFPSYLSIYERHRDTLHAHFMVWQRITPFWLGGTYSESIPAVTPDPYIWANSDPVPSVLTFLQTNAAIIANASGGLNSTKPTNWL